MNKGVIMPPEGKTKDLSVRREEPLAQGFHGHLAATGVCEQKLSLLIKWVQTIDSVCH